MKTLTVVLCAIVLVGCGDTYQWEATKDVDGGVMAFPPVSTLDVCSEIVRRNPTYVCRPVVGESIHALIPPKYRL